MNFARVVGAAAVTLCAVGIWSTQAVAVPSATASAATRVGNDVSWPQCGRALPQGQAFGIVGVNDGLANNTNPCLSTELAWARRSVGGTSQPKTALYVNTGNPSGVAGIAWWPTSNTFAHKADGSDTNDTSSPNGDVVSVPNSAYGSCTAAPADDAACSYVYGYAKAYDDAHYRGFTPTSASTYIWWLDVETTNSWETTNTRANVADLEGMVSYFHTIGARVGLYSTKYQWGVITGSTITSTSPLIGLPNWTAGARSLRDAPGFCSSSAFTANSTVSLVQYVSKNLDYDYSCR